MQLKLIHHFQLFQTGEAPEGGAGGRGVLCQTAGGRPVQACHALPRNVETGAKQTDTGNLWRESVWLKCRDRGESRESIVGQIEWEWQGNVVAETDISRYVTTVSLVSYSDLTRSRETKKSKLTAKWVMSDNFLLCFDDLRWKERKPVFQIQFQSYKIGQLTWTAF